MHPAAFFHFAQADGLQEHMISCETTQKPLMLFHLVHNHGVTNALVFTKSTESTTRLVRLFEFFEKAWSAETPSHQPVMARAYSSDLGAAERKSILEKFRAQEIQMYGLWYSENLLYLYFQIQTRVLGFDIPWNRYKSCIARRELRCSGGHAEVCSSSRTNCSCRA
jgi:hypothetical protein